jgi:hypothetical protein
MERQDEDLNDLDEELEDEEILRRDAGINYELGGGPEESAEADLERLERDRNR